VYGNPDGGAWAETAKLDPQSWYDLGKVVCEYMVRAAPTAHRIVFRAPLVLSSNNARNGRQWLGALYDALLSGMGFGFESEEAQRTAGSEILIAEDFAAYVASAIGRPRSGTFNISGGFVRWCDMIDVLARAAGVRPQIVYFDPDRPLPHSVFRLPQRASRLDCSLAAGAYPLPAFGSWADSIERYVAQERALRKASGN
jgi:dTDP-4-dehydrorhamnose reductase